MLLFCAVLTGELAVEPDGDTSACAPGLAVGTFLSAGICICCHEVDEPSFVGGAGVCKLPFPPPAGLELFDVLAEAEVAVTGGMEGLLLVAIVGSATGCQLLEPSGTRA